MPEQRDQQDDRQRHAYEPQQCTSGEIHDVSSSMVASQRREAGGVPMVGIALFIANNRKRSASDSFSFRKNESESRKSARRIS
jgi:hypothetical protein